ncbi:MAG: ABC transporter ATP-binding protein [Anaeromassilibacillus sp.]|nr:ABC transporter ATP-binding protein [Anaeromassilibacillus sp.]MDY3779555.1 ABC transporter ATP-binding protein [Candidatus Limousia pullorum]
MNILKTENLTKYYGRFRGIENVNLTLEEGEKLGFIGQNGAGKSTFIRTALGYLKPNSGKTEIFGKDILTHREEILADVGYMSSECVFYKGMKVKDVLSYSAKLRKRDCSKEAKYYCERLQLDTNKKVEQLSLGNRKKLGIICAIQHNPKLYFFDEPTSGLDPVIQKEFFDILEEKHKQGASILLSSHVLGEISRFCEKAAVIKDGHIIACDTIENFSKAGYKIIRLADVKNMQAVCSIDGVFNPYTEGNNLTFSYSGDIKNLLGELSKAEFKDILISDPDFEESVIHYYTREGVK